MISSVLTKTAINDGNTDSQGPRGIRKALIRKALIRNWLFARFKGCLHDS